MLSVYAIDPQCVSDFEKLRYIADSCSAQQGRLISDIPNRRWTSQVSKSVARSKSTFLHGKRIEDALDRVRRSGLIPPLSMDKQRDEWAECVRIEHQIHPFRAIVSQMQSDGVNCTVHIDDLSNDNEFWAVNENEKIDRTADGITNCIKPLVERSRRIAIIDPYFRPALPECRDALKAILSITPLQHGSFESIDCHVAVDSDCEKKKTQNPDYIKRWGNNFFDDCRDRLPNVVPHGAKLKVNLWSKRHNDREFHDRYLLTDLGGISFGNSFTIAPGTKMSAKRIPLAERDEVLQDVNQPSTVYCHEGSIEIEGRRGKN